jgi:hypothetical protein
VEETDIATHHEDNESITLWQRAQFDPVLREYLFHCPNGGNRAPREAARLKRMGVRPGVSDYILPVPRGIYHSLWVELKPDVKGYYPKISTQQVEWRTLMIGAGNAAYIVKGWEVAIDIMLQYVNLDPGEWIDSCRDPRSQYDG